MDDFHARPYNDGNILRFGVRSSDKKAALEGWPKANVSAYVLRETKKVRLRSGEEEKKKAAIIFLVEGNYRRSSLLNFIRYIIGRELC